MGVPLVITLANVTEMLYMEVLKIIVSTMFRFCHFIVVPCVLSEHLFIIITSILLSKSARNTAAVMKGCAYLLLVAEEEE